MLAIIGLSVGLLALAVALAALQVANDTKRQTERRERESCAQAESIHRSLAHSLNDLERRLDSLHVSLAEDIESSGDEACDKIEAIARYFNLNIVRPDKPPAFTVKDAGRDSDD